MQRRFAKIAFVSVPEIPLPPTTPPTTPCTTPCTTPSTRRPASRILLIALVLFFTPIQNSHASHHNVIYLGLLPYLSSASLMKTWRPFADYLEKILHKKVIIKTAPTFKTFLKRTEEGRYDLLMTAPHFAALAVSNNGYRVIAAHNNDLAGDIVVAKNSRFQSISDLRGKTFATPGKLAAVSMLAEILLKRNGLSPDKDITIKATPAHNTALIAVAEGQVDAAVAIGGLYRRINASKKFNQLRKLAITDKVPHVMYIAKPSISDADFHALQLALTQPAPDSEGSTILYKLSKLYNWGIIVMPSQKNLDRLKPILSILEEQITENE